MNTLGSALRVTVFGQSHSAAIGCVIDGFPAGMTVDEEALRSFMARRAPGQGPWATRRTEADEVTFLSGLNAQGATCGAPIALTIRNTNTRPQDYEAMGMVPRPGHADYVAWKAWGQSWDRSGGGQFSGRLTAPLAAAGALCLQWLGGQGVSVAAHLASVASAHDEPFCARTLDGRSRATLQRQMETLADGREFPVLDSRAASAMQAAIEAARADGDSVGGVVEVVATGVPACLGSPMFEGVENQLARALFGIPAVKGVEFGAGFEAARRRGSETNDPYRIEAGAVTICKNDAGGILGGMTTGAPLLARVAVKPTSSIAKAQESVDLTTMENAELTVRGRHDPCIAPRAVPVVEAVFAIVISDLMLQSQP